MNIFSFWFGTAVGFIAFLLLILLLARPLFRSVFRSTLRKLITDPYSENLWEMVSASMRINPIINIENSLRAASGEVIQRPFGSTKKFLDFSGLIFSPAQLAVFATPETYPIDTRTVIGPGARRPLVLDIPLLLGGMGYGVALSEKVRIAMAKGTAAVGTATNTGEGGFLPEDRKYAKSLIIQYGKAKWSKEIEILQQADAIEIFLGQGAYAAVSAVIPAEDLEGRAREILGLAEGEDAIIPSRHKELQSQSDLKRLVDYLRDVGHGVPVGIKLCAGQRLEEDLEYCLRAKVDFISIDGGQAGTKGAAPILEDACGLPTIYALSRAVRFLEAKGARGKVSLLIGGGFFTPDTCLKALALGADAVYMGTAPLWAMTHTQMTKTLPYEPPTQLVFYNGSAKDEFDEDKAALHLKNFFNSFVAEMKTAVEAIGKGAIRDVDCSDLIALDERTSQVTGVQLAYTPDQDRERDRGNTSRWRR